MKRFVFFFLLLSGFTPGRNKFFTLAEAERITGQKMEIVRNDYTNNNGVGDAYLDFKATEKDPKTNRDVVLYTHIEYFPDEAAAHAFYEKIWRENPGWSAANKVTNLGDEAARHTDNRNFYLYFARKGRVIYRAKINKLTPKANLTALLQTMQRAIEAV